jgi:hypothetical protein
MEPRVIPARLTRGLLAAGICLATVTAGCSSGTGDLEGRWSTMASPTPTTTPSSPTTGPAPTGTLPAAPAAVARELDELARNLRDLSKAPNSRDAMTSVSSALAATRADLKRLRANAYGTAKSCSTVDAALASTRSDAAGTSSAAARVRSLNQVRSALLAKSKATVVRLSAAMTAGGRTPAPSETAAVADARTTIAAAADQISRTAAAASSAVATAADLRATAESIAAKAC